MIKNNSKTYPEYSSQRYLDEEKFQLFPAKVLSVDWERKVCTIQDERNQISYSEIRLFPANMSGAETFDINMPEEGSHCLACYVYYRAGYSKVAIVSWLVSGVNAAVDAIATQEIKGLEGWNQRKRGLYRKTYPGQRSVSNKHGYTEKQGTAWDRSSSDLSREKVNSYSRTWYKTTSRKVNYSDAGLTFEGQVDRPKAEGIKPESLPDGSQRYTVNLDPNSELQDRYVSGAKDVLAFSEKLERIQEFSLDYPIPVEILESEYIEQVLGATEDVWQRTEIKELAGVSYDDKSFMVNQAIDHPSPLLDSDVPVGPTVKEGITPKRKGYIIERSEGTLVGYNYFDKSTYGKVLKPTLFPNTRQGRFGTDVESGYLPVQDSPDHVEARVAASTHSLRFPYEYNTTRSNISKEGALYFELGATLPKENIEFKGDYEHPHGAGRSLEGHLTGSLKLVVGKNRDEEDSIDLQALGQIVLRVGADDSSLPDYRRNILTQERSKNDTLQKRTLNYWKSSRLKPGGCNRFRE
jgi:hypothetical protein